MKLAVLFLFIFCDSASASLVDEFLEQNLTVQKNNASSELSKLGVDALWSTKAWYLSGAAGYSDNNLDASTSINTQQGKAKSFEAVIGKPFSWGGELALANSFTRNERLAQNLVFLGGGSPIINQFSQTLSYEQELGQNLFGKRFRKELLSAEKQAALVENQGQAANEGELLAFYITFLDGSLNLELDRLQEEAVIRAKRRRDLTRKKVRDGLRERVDLYQAEMVLINQRELEFEAKAKITSALETLSLALHRPIYKEELEKLNYRAAPNWNNNLTAGNRSIKSLKTNINYLKNEMARIEDTFFPEIKLSASYKANDYDPASSKTISNGNLSGDKNEFVLGLTVTMPLGFDPQDVEKAQNRINVNIAEAELKKSKSNLLAKVRSRRERLFVLEKNIGRVKQRLVFAKKALRELNKLYNVGKADLLQLIRGEEDLINTEKSYVSYLAQRSILLASLALQFGILEDHLRNWVDERPN